MQPEQMVLGNPKAKSRPDFVIIETEKGKVMYERNKQADSLALTHKREWSFQTYLAFKNPNRAFMLDSLLQEELKDEGIIARTAVRFSQGGSVVSCSNDSLCQAGIALEPVVFGVEHDPRQIKLQAYVLFSRFYLISRMPLIWGLILLWFVPVIFMYIWQRRKKKDEVVVVPHLMEVAEVEELAQGIFWNEKTGELRKKDHVVFLKKNRLHAFICLLRAPNHTRCYEELCKNVLDRPLREDELTDENIEWNQSAKKTLAQTILRLKKDLKEFPELSIENVPGLGYRLIIKSVLSESEMRSVSGGNCMKLPTDLGYELFPEWKVEQPYA